LKFEGAVPSGPIELIGLQNPKGTAGEEDERTAVCGPAHARQPGRKAYRNGHAPGELALGGRRVSASRPRARTVDGAEIVLPSWQLFGDEIG
jgi:hypothetical protein